MLDPLIVALKAVLMLQKGYSTLKPPILCRFSTRNLEDSNSS